MSNKRYSVLVSALCAALPTSLVFANKNPPFYAYEIGMRQDPDTGILSRDRTPINEVFWRVCYPRNPANEPPPETRDRDPQQRWKNHDLWERWFRLAYVAIVPGDERCPPGFIQELVPIENEQQRDIEPGAARVLRRHIFDKTMVRKWSDSGESDGELDITWHEYSLGYHQHSDYAWYDDMNTLELFGGFPNEWDKQWKRVAWRFEGLDPPQLGPEDHEIQLVFNTALQMGKAQNYEYNRRKSGYGFVDWHLNRDTLFEYDLAACEDPEKPHRVLAIIDRTEVLQDRSCIRIMLTTSANQLDHIKDLWNERQKMWEEFKIIYHSPPWYSSNYILKEQGIGRPPVITRKGKWNGHYIVFPDGKLPLNQQFNAETVPTGTQTLDMDRELVDDLIARVDQGEDVPRNDNDDDGSEYDYASDSAESHPLDDSNQPGDGQLVDNRGDHGGMEVEDDQRLAGGRATGNVIDTGRDGGEAEAQQADALPIQTAAPNSWEDTRQQFQAWFGERREQGSNPAIQEDGNRNGNPRMGEEEKGNSREKMEDEDEPPVQKKGAFRREDDEKMHMAPRRIDWSVNQPNEQEEEGEESDDDGDESDIADEGI